MENNDDLKESDKRRLEEILEKYKNKKNSWPNLSEGIDNLVTLITAIFWGIVGLYLWGISGSFIVKLLQIKSKTFGMIFIVCIWPILLCTILVLVGLLLHKIIPPQIKQKIGQINLEDIGRKIAIATATLFLLHCFFYTLCHKYHIWCPSENYEDISDAPPF